MYQLISGHCQAQAAWKKEAGLVESWQVEVPGVVARPVLAPLRD